MDPDPSNTFTILFEEDPDLSSIDLTECNSRALWRSHKTETQPEVASEPDYILTEEEISGSHMSGTLSTVQPLDSSHTLLILNLTCNPCAKRRFMNATIDMRVGPQRSSTSGPRSSFDLSPSPSPRSGLSHTSSPSPRSHPKVVGLAPQLSIGGQNEEQIMLRHGVSFPISASFGPASAGITPSVEKQTQKVVAHAMTIVGSLQSYMKCAHWTVKENESSRSGIPTHFRVAVVIEHNGPFVVKLEVKAELSGRLWPQSIVSKGGNSLQKTIDVETWRCGEIELAPGETAWRAFLADFTGAVPGLMREFGQIIVRA